MTLTLIPLAMTPLAHGSWDAAASLKKSSFILWVKGLTPIGHVVYTSLGQAFLFLFLLIHDTFNENSTMSRALF